MLHWPDLQPHLRPPHAYVPGQTPRHRDGWFDRIKASVRKTVDPEALSATPAFKTGLAYLGAGYFWEAHEVLEAVWMQTPDPSAERAVVQALIQLANARLKLLMTRPKAAARLCDMVAAHLESCGNSRVVLGLQIADLWQEVDRTRALINDNYTA